MMSKQIIGIVTNYTEGAFQQHVIAGVEAICKKQNYATKVLTFVDNLSFQQEILDVAGLIIITNALSDTLILELYESALPLTLVSHNITSISVPAITTNNREGVRHLMQHIVEERERKKPIFICGDMAQIDARQRYNAFVEELLRYNIPYDEHYILQGDFVPETAAEQMQSFIKSGHPFDAVIASDYLMALASIDVLNGANINIPQDVSVIGFGDGEQALKRGLSTIAADVTELGNRAARQIIGQIEGLTIQGLTLLSTELIIRNSS